MHQGKLFKTNPPSKRTAAQRKVNTGSIVFYTILLTMVLLFFIVLLFVMNALNSWLVRFEASQPSTKAQMVFSQLFQDPDWSSIYQLDEEPGDVTAEDYTAYMEHKFGNAKLTFFETSAGLSKDKKYIVRCGSEKVATFTLHNNDPEAEIPDWQLGNVKIYYSADLSVTVLAAPDFTVTVNGETLTDSHVVRSVTTKAENYLPEGVHGYRMNELLVEGLLAEPDVQVLAPDGTQVELTYDSTSRTYSPVSVAPSPTDVEQKQLLDAAEAYCKYMIGASKKNELKQHFDSNSQIYKTITSNTTWMQNYKDFSLDGAKVNNFYRYNDGLFSARVTLTVNVVRKDGSTKVYPLDNTFFIENIKNQWLVTEMTNANAQEEITSVRLTYVSNGDVLQTLMVPADVSTLEPPAAAAVEGKKFAGWFTEAVDESGVKTMELAFLPGEDGTVRLPEDSVLEPMTLHALYQ